MGPPVTFELKVREQNQLGFWNTSIKPTSGATLIKVGRRTFSTSGTVSQTVTVTVAKERPEKFWPERDSNPDLCDADAVLHQLR